MTGTKLSTASQASEPNLARREEGDLTDAQLQAVAGGFLSDIVGAVRVYTAAMGGNIGGAIRGAKQNLGK
mgnify:CR=1 FL=1